MAIQDIQERVQHITNFTTPTGAGAAVTGALTLNDWLGITGVGIALAGFAVNWYYQRQRYLLEKERLND